MKKEEKGKRRTNATGRPEQFGKTVVSLKKTACCGQESTRGPIIDGLDAACHRPDRMRQLPSL
jgi:hypothetical protein